MNREEKIEYRDQDGNLLDEKQVSDLEGKVSFSTRYETRTRIINEEGKEIGEGVPGAEGFAPPHPDVERQPETQQGESGDGKKEPATASVEDDVKKEKKLGKENGVPKPASERDEATGK